MKKKHMLLIFAQLLLFVWLHCTSFEVCLSGTKDFSTIQGAIDASDSGSTITVFPGIYKENLVISGKELVLQSLYSEQGDTAFINTTVISGDVRGPAIYIGSTGWMPEWTDDWVTIDGFTIMNNEQEQITNCSLFGGGIDIYWSNALIKNNIIRNCLAGNGSGINIESGSIDHIVDLTVKLENNQIFDNIALDSGGGGIAMRYTTKVMFSEERRNSVYNNQAIFAHDIRFSHHVVNDEIFLDKGSRIMPSGDGFFIGSHSDYNFWVADPKNIKVHILQETMPVTVNKELYVAPWGDDDNSGLSYETALKTIDRATKLIAGDPEHPKTIYLAAGEYSPSLNSQIFPFSIPNFVNLVGAGIRLFHSQIKINIFSKCFFE